jgi:hypothetical protein
VVAEAQYDAACVREPEDAAAALRACALVVGLYPDQAVDALVDFALCTYTPSLPPPIQRPTPPSSVRHMMSVAAPPSQGLEAAVQRSCTGLQQNRVLSGSKSTRLLSEDEL